MKKKKDNIVTYDSSTDTINRYLSKVPGIGSLLSRAYLWKFCTFNFMIVGASGMLLSFALYEGVFRVLLGGFWGGTFLGMVITTLIVFLWNYFWNRHWSLGIKSQILTMNKGELLDLQERIRLLLKQKFATKGSE